MSKNDDPSIEDFRLFLASYMIKEADRYSHLIDSLHPEMLKTTNCGADFLKMLESVHKAKMELLDEIFKEFNKVAK